jgi:hypothetical protein
MGGVPDDLRKIFLRLGKEKGLDESLLEEVLDHLVKSQYLAKGDRTHVTVQLRRILEKHE